MSDSASLRAVEDELPEPPYPPETRANGWQPAFDVQRIQTSDTWTLAEDDERPWLLRIWLEAWQSTPVGSMPSDRRLFARRIGCKRAFLDAHAEILLRGWVLHTDGLLYHAYITEQVLGMVTTRRKSADKVRAWRQKKASAQHEVKADVTGNTGDGNGYLPVSNRQDRTGQDRTGLRGDSPESVRARERKPTEPKPKPTARGARLTLSELPDTWRIWCQDHRPDLDPSEAWEQFRDYWVAQPGQKGVKVDWMATWRNWCRREQQRSSNPARRPTKADQLTDANRTAGDEFVGGGVIEGKSRRIA